MWKFVKRFENFDYSKSVRSFSKTIRSKIPSTTSSEFSTKFKEWKSKIVGFVTVVGVVSLALSSYDPAVKLFRAIYPPNIEKVTVQKVTSNFVDRPELSNILKKIMEWNYYVRNYIVIYGPAGAGKSTIVLDVASQLKSVIEVSISDHMTKTYLRSSLMENFGSYGETDIIKALQKVNEKGIRPTFIFDCRRTTSPKTLIAIRSTAIEISNYSRPIIIISDIHSTIYFQTHYWPESLFIGEMTESEASAYLALREVKLSDEERSYIFDNIGTLPLMLENLVSWREENPTSDVKEFVTLMLFSASKKLQEFKLKPILKALKQNPDGVCRSMFRDQKYQGVSLFYEQELSEYLRANNCNVIHYHSDTDTFQLQSTALKTALKTYDVVVDNDEHYLPSYHPSKKKKS